MKIRTFRTSSEIGCVLVAVACCSTNGCNAITGLSDYDFPEPVVTDCGKLLEHCATSLLVEGGTFVRGVDVDGTTELRATVSSFRLDKFEITVGRFREFVNDVVINGWNPPVGSGKHPLNYDANGVARGLRVPATGGYESGWRADFPALRTSKAAWNINLTDPTNCPHHTWTSEPGANERLPINCITWSEAQAFCIWDGGYLPSETEWLYAFVGGAEQRGYPWSAPRSKTPPPDATHAVFGCLWPDGGAKCATVGTANIAPVGMLPSGDGKWHHADLGGNLTEWTGDFFEKTFKPECIDCAAGENTSNRAIRGAAFLSDPGMALESTYHEGIPPEQPRHDVVGARCARAP